MTGAMDVADGSRYSTKMSGLCGDPLASNDFIIGPVFSLSYSRFAWGVLVIAVMSVTTAAAQSAYLGFDRNDYPGDSSLGTLRQRFSYTGYWLNNPPGA